MSNHREGDRLPPSDVAAERATIGSMIQRNNVIPDVLAIVDADDFYRDSHQKLVRAITHLWDKSKPVDAVTLADVLRDRKELEDVGGYPYLGELLSAAPTGYNAEHHAGIVRDMALKRRLIHVGTETVLDGYEGTGEAADLVEAAEQRIFAIAKSPKSALISLDKVIGEVSDEIDRMSVSGNNRDGRNLGLCTNFLELDELLGGFHQELIVVAARPSVGKTAFALNCALRISQNGDPVLFVSLEQSRSELAMRIMSCEAQVAHHRLKHSELTVDEINRLVRASGELRQTKMLIDDGPGQSLMQISGTCRRCVSKHGIKAIFIDYLQLIEAGPSGDAKRRYNRQEEVSALSRRLKNLSRELKIPVVCLAQLNRGVEDRAEQKPRLSDLRESGAIEQDADTVILLSRGTTGIITVDVAKQRNGPTREVLLTFMGEYLRFETHIPMAADRPVTREREFAK